MTNRFKTGLMILLSNNLEDFNSEDYLEWDEDETLQYVIELIIKLEDNNYCPFKSYEREELCPHQKCENCIDDLIIDCDEDKHNIWERWIIANTKLR